MNTSDDEENLRRFLEDRFEGTPIKKISTKKKWDMIHESISCPDEYIEDSCNLLSAIESPFEKTPSNSVSSDTVFKKPGISSAKKLCSSKRIRCQQPGLKVFTGKPFKYFSFKDLDIERDFGYSGRQRIEKVFGPLENRMRDPLDFTLLLCPDSQSITILGEKDFTSICNYLFYACSSTISESTFELYSNALSDLLINYDYSWSLDFSRILTVYLNLGGDESVFLDEKIYKLMMNSRLELVNKISKLRGVDKSLSSSSLFSNIIPKFCLSKVANIDKYFLPLHTKTPKKNSSNVESETALESRRYGCIKRFTVFITKLILSQKKRWNFFKPNEDWTELLMLMHTFGLIATDKNLYEIYPDVSCDICSIFDAFIEAFSPRQWSGNFRIDARSEEPYTFYEVSGLCDLARVFLYLGLCRDSRRKTWEPESLPKGDYFRKEMDHHHNILYRLSSLIPPSRRGVHLLKVASYVCFQFLIFSGKEISLKPEVSVEDLAILLADADIRKTISFFFQSEHYACLSLVRLIDFIVGNDPVVDFSQKKIQFVKKISELLNSLMRKLRDDFFDSNPSYLKEVVNQMLCKWNLFSLNSSKSVNAKITDFVISKPSIL